MLATAVKRRKAFSMPENLRLARGRVSLAARRVAVAVLATCALATCHGDDPATSRALRGVGLGPPATIVATVPTPLPRVLTEMSGAAMSTTQPGVFFTINDSGNDPLLFALDTTGAARGEWRIRAENVDWEALSEGPCAPAAPAAAEPRRCVSIGDTGDNAASHAHRTIYRVAEPRVAPGGDLHGARAAERRLVPDSVAFTYPDGAHDVEAMFVAPDGDVFLVTKRALRVALRLRPALVFRIPAAAWSSRRPLVAQLVDSLPIIPGSVPFRTITDAALSGDAKHLAVRTYAQLFIFATDSATGRVNHDVAPVTCDVTGAGEPQGEGVTWIHDDGPLLLTSEGARAPLQIVRCG
jgi:hypothetical protein